MEERQIRTAMITGATGAGSYLLEYIATHHPEVRLVGTARSGKIDHNHWEDFKNMPAWCGFRPYGCDFSHLDMWIDILLETRPDAIFHLASDARVRESFDDPVHAMQNNVVACGAVFFEGVRRAREKDSSFDPIIQQCSTSEVYGQVRPEDVPVKETQPCSAISPYAVSKVAQDMLAESYHKNFGLKVIRTRMFTYLNPRRPDLFATAFAMQVARIEAGLQAVLLHGNLDSIRAMIDVRDAVAAYWLAVKKCRFGEAYNIGGKQTISVGDFLELLKKKARRTIPSRIDPLLLRPSEVTLPIPDISKFTSETGWLPRYSFEESVAYLLEHCRKEVTQGGV